MEIIRSRAGRDPRENRQCFARKSTQQGQHRGNQDDREHYQIEIRRHSKASRIVVPRAKLSLARFTREAGPSAVSGKLELSDKRRHRAYPRSVSARRRSDA